MTCFEFANLAYESNFGALLLFLWKVWIGTFCQVCVCVCMCVRALLMEVPGTPIGWVVCLKLDIRL